MRMSASIVLILSCCYGAIDGAGNAPPIVQTPQGSLEGAVQQSRNNQTYYAFKGIPYAEYPGRFEVAKQFASWDGIRPAKKLGAVCAQMDSCLVPDTHFIGEEMCLFLNVYTPTLAIDTKLPVLFWIHGGCYMTGSGNGFDGKYLADENVILVTVNYRLGPLGFLSFGDDNGVSPNIGLKDQLLALKWVNQNIASFGGDPEKVTVAGFSAGAASAHLHMLSKQTSGLFRSVISHSGDATAFWAMDKQNPREKAEQLATYLDCPIGNTEQTIACFKTKSAKEFTEAQMNLRGFYSYPLCLFIPVVEPPSDDSFITELPETILENGNYNKVNWVAGFTEDESSPLDTPLIMNQTLTDALENDWEKNAPIMLGYEHLEEGDRNLVSEKIREFYFEKFDVGELTWTSLRELLSDRFFIEPVVRSLELASKHANGKLYPYVFRFAGDFSSVHATYGVEGDFGIAHGDDLQYLFPGGDAGAPDYSGENPAQVVEFSKNYVKLWADIIRTGEPSKQWLDKTFHWTSYSNVNKTAVSPVKFFEIAIEVGTWNENIQPRMDLWREVFNISSKKDKHVRTEL